MADGTAIEWTHRPGTKGETWNPIAGCDVVSPGCTNCYAMRQAHRIALMAAGAGRPTHYDGTTKLVKGKPVWTGKIAVAPDHVLTKPLRWTSPRTVFVNSMSDLFHDAVADEVIDRIFAVMALCPQHVFIVLTKRAARMRAYLTTPHNPGKSITILDDDTVIDTPAAHVRAHAAMCDLFSKVPPQALNLAAKIQDERCPDGEGFMRAWPLPNVWLGVSAEDQARADERLPDLLATPAAVRLVSAEPLLGPIDFLEADPYAFGTLTVRLPKREPGAPKPDIAFSGDATLGGMVTALGGHMQRRSGIDWVIVGGESGRGARPMHPAWARDIRDQCAEAGVPFFFKQWGAWKPVSQMANGECDDLYYPPPANDPEAIRRCKVASTVMHADGGRHDDPCDSRAFAAGSGAMTMFEVGKSRSGRLLDGIEHNEFPQTRRTPA